MLLSLLALLAIKTAALLQPSGPWALDSLGHGCIARSNYGSDQPVQLSPVRNVTDPDPYIILAAPRQLMPRKGRHVLVAFDESKPEKMEMYTFDSADPQIGTWKLSPSASQMAALATAQSIRIGNVQPLGLTGVNAAVEAVDNCLAERIASWGEDPKVYFEKRSRLSP